MEKRVWKNTGLSIGTTKTVIVYRFKEEQEKPALIRSFTDILSSPLLPGFALQLSQLIKVR